MLFDKYKNKIDRYIFENITFRITTIVLAFAVVLLSYTIITRTATERVVFMPPKVINQEFWIAGDEVSKGYLHEMGQFVAFNLMNITKNNANNNIENILTLIDPRFYADTKLKLNQQMDYIIDNAISRTFFVSGIDADTRGVIKVFGVVKDIISDKVVRSTQSILKIQYEINQGRFIINDIVIEEDKPNGTKNNA